MPPSGLFTLRIQPACSSSGQSLFLSADAGGGVGVGPPPHTPPPPPRRRGTSLPLLRLARPEEGGTVGFGEGSRRRGAGGRRDEGGRGENLLRHPFPGSRCVAAALSALWGGEGCGACPPGAPGAGAKAAGRQVRGGGEGRPLGARGRAGPGQAAAAVGRAGPARGAGGCLPAGRGGAVVPGPGGGSPLRWRQLWGAGGLGVGTGSPEA